MCHVSTTNDLVSKLTVVFLDHLLGLCSVYSSHENYLVATGLFYCSKSYSNKLAPTKSCSLSTGAFTTMFINLYLKPTAEIPKSVILLRESKIIPRKLIF